MVDCLLLYQQPAIGQQELASIATTSSNKLLILPVKIGLVVCWWFSRTPTYVQAI